MCAQRRKVSAGYGRESQMAGHRHWMFSAVLLESEHVAQTQSPQLGRSPTRPHMDDYQRHLLAWLDGVTQLGVRGAFDTYQ